MKNLKTKDSIPDHITNPTASIISTTAVKSGQKPVDPKKKGRPNNIRIEG